MPNESLPNQVWSSDDAWARVLRAGLTPLAWTYGAVVATRRLLYERGVIASYPTAVPAISVGNLTVGGTGKTPIAAWLAAMFLERGARPAIVLRGYGGDEPLVHRVLNPQVPVIVAADRVAGVAQARAMGCDLAVLDDAFQHRRARRLKDIVLVSADRWDDNQRLLPAGPWREPLESAVRASLVIVTRKGASLPIAEMVRDRVQAIAPGVPMAIAHLAPEELRSASGDACLPLTMLRGVDVLAISAIADPAAFRTQVESLGARVRVVTFADHHAYTGFDVSRLAAEGERVDYVVSTLKDCVKLASLWPRAARSLWYVSQRVGIDSGGDAIDALITEALTARSTLNLSTAGAPTAGLLEPPYGH
jgi:tetraacyldisaccharide 4'-kinase